MGGGGGDARPAVVAHGLALGVVDAGSHLLRTVVVRNANGRRLQATLSGENAANARVVVAGSTFNGSGPHDLPAGGASVRIGLWLVVPMREGALGVTLRIAWEGGSGEAAFEGRSRLFSITESVSFGSVTVGESARRRVTIENHARAELEVQLTGPDAPFAASSAGTVTLPARGACELSCELAPEAAGPVASRITVSCAGIRKLCTLEGEGIEPPVRSTAAAVHEATGASASATTEYQRLYFHVPTLDTNVTLGKELRVPRDTHAGFSATTQGHVLLRTWEEGRSITFQAPDQVWIQSTTKSAYLGAGEEGISLVAEGHAYLSSGRGIFLSAGYGDIENDSVEELGSEKAPPEPKLAEIDEALKKVQLGWTIANTVGTALNAAQAQARAELSITNKLLSLKWQELIDPTNVFLTLPLLGTSSAALMSALSIGHALPPGSINGFSTGPILGATLAHASIYGGTGVSVRSLNTAVLGMVNASYDALVSAGLFGFRGAALSSMSGITIESAFKTQVGSGGPLEIKAPSATFTGGKVLVHGGSEVSLAAPTVATTAALATILANEALFSADLGEVTFAVGTKFGITVGKAGVMVGSLAGTAVDPSKPHLLISREQGIKICGSASTFFKADGTEAALATLGGAIRVDATGLTIDHAVRTEVL